MRTCASIARARAWGCCGFAGTRTGVVPDRATAPRLAVRPAGGCGVHTRRSVARCGVVGAGVGLLSCAPGEMDEYRA